MYVIVFLNFTSRLTAGFFIYISLTVFSYFSGKFLTMDKFEKPNGCSIIVIVAVILGLVYYFTKSDEKKGGLNPCFISKHFIKKDLNYPDEAEMSMLDCNSTEDNPNYFTVIRKVKASNAFGVKQEYIYKLTLKYKGGESSDESNWELLSIKNEKYSE